MVTKPHKTEELNPLEKFEHLDRERSVEVKRYKSGGISWEGLMDRLDHFIVGVSAIQLNAEGERTFTSIRNLLLRMKSEQKYNTAFELLCTRLHAKIREGIQMGDRHG